MLSSVASRAKFRDSGRERFEEFIDFLSRLQIFSDRPMKRTHPNLSLTLTKF